MSNQPISEDEYMREVAQALGLGRGAAGVPPGMTRGGIAAIDGEVVFNLGESMSWFAMTPRQARDIAAALVAVAAEAEGAQVKRLEDMTEPELRELTTAVLDAVKALLPPASGFCVLFWPQGRHKVSQYGSNCRRADMVKALREAADRLAGREDVPR